MYFRACVAIVFLATCLECAPDTEKFQFFNCDASAPIRLNITEAPDPFTLKDNAKFPVSGTLAVTRNLPQGIFVKISLAKKKDDDWERIPCVGCDFGLDCKKVPEMCFIRTVCKNCSLSFSNVELVLPEDIEDQITNVIPNFDFEGHYWLRVMLDDPRKDDKDFGKVLGCFEAYFNLTTDDDVQSEEEDKEEEREKNKDENKNQKANAPRFPAVG